METHTHRWLRRILLTGCCLLPLTAQARKNHRRRFPPIGARMDRPHRISFLALWLLPGVLCAGLIPEGPEFQVNTYTTGDQRHPDVAMDGAGNFIIVWHSFTQDGWDFGVFGQRYDREGNPVGGEFQVNTFINGNQVRPVVAISAAADFVVAWSGPDGNDDGVFAQRYDASGAPNGSEFRVNTLTSNNFTGPAVAMAPRGDFVIVWPWHYRQFEIRGQRYDALGSPQGTELQITTEPSSYQTSVSTDSNGAFVVTWTGVDADRSGIFARRYDPDGMPLGGRFQVNTDTTGFQRHADVSVSPSGGFVVVWQSEKNGPPQIFGQRYDEGGATLGGEFQISQGATGSRLHYFPDIALNPLGNFSVVWLTIDSLVGSSPDIFVRSFDATAAPLEDEFIASAFSTGFQNFPSIASDGAGRFVVVWEGVEPDGWGVFARRFRCVPLPGSVEDLAIARDPTTGDLTLTWIADATAEGYVVLENVAPEGAFASVATPTSTSAVLPGPEGDRFYLVAGRSAECGQGPSR